MTRRHRLHSVLARLFGAIGQPPDRRARPSLEALEDRCLLAVFTATTVADSGPGSLRQAILDSNANPGADTIAFNIGGEGYRPSNHARFCPRSPTR
jgi:hypothetical protein